MKKLLGTLVVSLIVLAVTSLGLMLAGVTTLGVNIGAILLALETAYLVWSFGIVKYNEVAAKFFLGAAVGDLEPGFYFAPYGIVTVRKAKGTRQSDELPGDPEEVFLGEDRESLPPGMFRVIRIKFGGPRDDDDVELKADPYHREMVINVVPVVVWRIPRGSASTFFTNYDGRRAFRKIVADKVVGICGNQFATVTPAKASRNLESTNQELTDQIRSELGVTGVDIIEIYIKPFGFSHELNSAVVGVAIAMEDVKTVGHRAAAERNKRILEGQGAADARRSMINAEAEGATRKAELAATEEGRLALALEALRAGFENPGATIFHSSEAVGGLFASLGTALKKIKGVSK